MQEDYLWDKSGEDAEIERLEAALKPLRYRENAPPVVTATVIPFVKAETGKRFQWSNTAAIAACLLFGVLAGAVWIQILRNNLAENNVAEMRQNQNADAPKAQPIDEIFTPEKLPPPPAVKLKNVDSKVRLRIVQARQVMPVSPVRAQRTKMSVVKREIEPAVNLTAEEKYAYDQLMLALSITSSKLKIVKDKVDGIDDATANIEAER